MQRNQQLQGSNFHNCMDAGWRWGEGETRREKLCFPLQASQDSHKWTACHEPTQKVQTSWISSWDPGDLCGLDLTSIILDPAHTIKHNPFPLVRAVVNICHWRIHVFQGPFPKLAADLTQAPRTPLCCPFMKNPLSRAVKGQSSSPDCSKHTPVFTAQLHCPPCWAFHSPHSH